MEPQKLEINAIAQKYIDRIAEKCAEIKPLVVINCITYNHEKYLKDALEGFVMQKTDFHVVAVVHDDASTDGTAAILRQYAEKYPDIILPIYEEENQYNKSLGRVMRAARQATGAKYVAMCEGDDYWTSPHKLQKQADFLQSHPDYSMVFHNAIEHWQDGSIPDRSFSNLEERDYTGLEIYKKWIVPTASTLLRISVYESETYKKAIQNKKILFGDIRLFLSAAAAGKLFAMSDTMSVYRRHPGGVTYDTSIDRDLRIIEHQKAIIEVFGSEYKPIANKHISRLYMSIRNKYIKEGKRLKASANLFKSISHDPTSLKAALKRKLHL